jgi:hypothetical protein
MRGGERTCGRDGEEEIYMYFLRISLDEKAWSIRISIMIFSDQVGHES